MPEVKLSYEKIEGKTYSLFNNHSQTVDYYKTIKNIAKEILYDEPDIRAAINILRKGSRNSFIKKILNRNGYKLPFSPKQNKTITNELSKYTIKAKHHINSLPITKYFDKTISAAEFQYHLYMIEIELTCMANKRDFMDSELKIALLPHCLRESIPECKAKTDKFDMKCMYCKKTCYINNISKILRKNGILPYIWMQADLKKLSLISRRKPGIFGIACIPELVNGLRMCEKYKMPAIGMPLNANRCRRWMGDFYPNSVDLMHLDELLSKTIDTRY